MSNVVTDKKKIQSIDSSDWYTSIIEDIKEANNLIASLQSTLSSLQATVNSNKRIILIPGKQEHSFLE